MRRVLAATALLAAVVGVLALGDRASATNGVMDDFTRTYPATVGTALDSCSTCHTSVPALNPYGSAVKSGGFNFESVQSLDSDGDGFSNIQEIQALTRPGDASDHPVVTSTTSTTTTSTTMVTSPTPSPTTTTTSTAPQLSVPAATADAIAFDAGPAGTVWLAVDNGRLVVADVETAWSYEEEFEDDGHEIEIKFRNGAQEVEFEAELEDGKIKTEIEIETDDDHSDRHNDDDNDHDDDDDDHDDDDHDDDDD